MGLIGAAIGAAGSIFGGIKASQAMREAKRMVEKQNQDNQNWYDRRYNEDATQRGDAQRILQQTQDYLKRRNKAIAGTSAVMGGTDAGVASAQQANNNALAQATSAINAQAEAQKGAIEDNYLGIKRGLDAQLVDLQKQKAQHISNAIKGVAGASAGMDFGDVKMGGVDIAL